MRDGQTAKKKMLCRIVIASTVWALWRPGLLTILFKSIGNTNTNFLKNAIPIPILGVE